VRRSRYCCRSFQALDQATGYLMAAAAIRGLAGRLVRGAGAEARLSLARTAKLLIDQSAAGAEPPFAAETEADWSPAFEASAWGPARRVRPPPEIAGTPMAWAHPAGGLGTAEVVMPGAGDITPFVPRPG
jgi:hypothetical protein